MCFYNQTLWMCGYWRWGKFQQQCDWEHAIGETCGLKLISGTNKKSEPCDICHRLGKKQRKIEKLEQDIVRWHHEGDRPASIEKAQKDLVILMSESTRLLESHQSRARFSA
ncbi:hypothetical protein B0I35DRAFT_91519 [Stachybotrys elegans]|uniref:Uncharacterized protein n=1 Tax=Stachybotrys elegans TaxID=80388 RepID=A0A8K0WM61_9HYPO|nr:hypothetical protein B0I35DRAFT_91519 [Stachybotrys elegans]